MKTCYASKKDGFIAPLPIESCVRRIASTPTFRPNLKASIHRATS